MNEIKGLKAAKSDIKGWIEANEAKMLHCGETKNYYRAAELKSYNEGMQQAMDWIEDALISANK